MNKKALDMWYVCMVGGHMRIGYRNLVNMGVVLLADIGTDACEGTLVEDFSFINESR